MVRKMRMKFRRKLECVVCGVKKRPRDIKVEYLKPMREGQPYIQFVVEGKCGHVWKMAADEIGYESPLGLV